MLAALQQPAKFIQVQNIYNVLIRCDISNIHRTLVVFILKNVDMTTF